MASEIPTDEHATNTEGNGKGKSDQQSNNAESAIAKALPGLIDKAIDAYITFKEQERADDNKALELITKHDWRIISVLLLFAGVILTVMAVLAYLDKVSGDALLFAVGSGFGYVFALIQRFLLSPRSPKVEGGDLG